MSSTKNPGRFAGMLYLLTSIIVAFAIIYVPSKLIVTGNTAATANNITACETLFRLGIAAELIGQAGFIFVALALYDLFTGVSRRQASLMVTLIVVSIPIAFLNEVNAIAALVLVRGADFLSVFEKPQRDALAMLFLSCIITDLWLPKYFGSLALSARLLVYRSRFLPRFLASASHRRLRERDPESYRRTVAAISAEGVYPLPACHVRGGCLHAMALDQGCKAASAGGHRRIGGQRLEANLRLNSHFFSRRTRPLVLAG